MVIFHGYVKLPQRVSLIMGLTAEHWNAIDVGHPLVKKQLLKAMGPVSVPSSAILRIRRLVIAAIGRFERFLKLGWLPHSNLTSRCSHHPSTVQNKPKTIAEGLDFQILLTTVHQEANSPN